MVSTNTRMHNTRLIDKRGAEQEFLQLWSLTIGRRYLASDYMVVTLGGIQKVRTLHEGEGDPKSARKLTRGRRVK